MIVSRTSNLTEPFVILTLFTSLLSAQQQQHAPGRLFRILASLQSLRPQVCQFKFENCMQDSSYADHLATECDIYSRLRDCSRALFDEPQCRTSTLKHQYKLAKQKEYESCGVASAYEAAHSFWQTSSASRLPTTCRTVPLLLLLPLFLFVARLPRI